MSRFRLLLLVSSLPLLVASTWAQGGQRVSFTFPPGQTTTGNGQVGVQVGGQTVLVGVPPGTGSTGLTQAVEDGLRSRGFAVERPGPNTVTVTAGPGGAPLTTGGGMGSTDSGIQGVRTGVEPNAAPPVKQAGGAIPVPPGNQPCPRAGTIVVTAETERVVNGQRERIPVHVQIPLNQGETPEQVKQRVRQMLESQGFKVEDVEVPSNLDRRIQLPGLGMDHMQDGRRVQAVDFSHNIPPEFLPLELWGGMQPLFGGASYGLGDSLPDGKAPFLHLPIVPQVGGPFPLTLHGQLQGVSDIVFLSFGPAGFPIPLQPTSFLLIDPLVLLPFPGITDPLGLHPVPLVIPPEPALHGLDLYFQAVVIGPTPQTIVTTPGLQVTIR